VADFSRPFFKATRIRNGGQILVEYVLMLVLVVGLAVLITKALIKNDPSDPGGSGLITNVWQKMTQAIGADHADDVN
jgi:hypothetical protein